MDGVLAIWGKILGGAAGLAIGGPIGAVIGAVAGHAYDHYRENGGRVRLTHQRTGHAWGRHAHRSKPLFNDPTETRRIAFATAVIVLGAKLAKADGAVTQDEIRAFKRTFRVDDREVGDVARIYNMAKRSSRGFEPYARQIAALFHRDPILLEELLAGLFQVARADAELNPTELDFLRSVATIFGFTTADFERIRSRHAASRGGMERAADAYAVLGLKEGASDEEVKQTYRRLVREHHPDRLVAKGLPQEFVERANQTLASINAAYDRITRERKPR